MRSHRSGEQFYNFVSTWTIVGDNGIVDSEEGVTVVGSGRTLTRHWVVDVQITDRNVPRRSWDDTRFPGEDETNPSWTHIIQYS